MIIYKTINQINGKIYVGKNKYNNPLYLGSGLLLERAFRKYGRENFRKEILEECSSLKELNEKEIFWIKKLNSQDCSIGYNIAQGGMGGDTISYHPNRDIIRKNKSQNNIKYYKDKKNHPSYGKIQSKESNEKRRNTILGIKRSELTRKKMSIAASDKNNSAYNKIWIHNKKIKKNKLIEKYEYQGCLIKGWKKGMLKS